MEDGILLDLDAPCLCADPAPTPACNIIKQPEAELGG